MRAAALLLALAGCGRTVPWDPPDDLATPADLGALPVDKLDLAEIAEVDAASPPVEECNGRDDDGDGLVDEKCIKPVSPPQSSIKRAHIDGDRIAVDHFFTFDVIDLVDGGVTRVEEAPPDGGVKLYATDGDLRGGWLAWRAVDQQQIIGYGVRARHLPTGRQFMRSDPRLKDYGPVQVDEGRVVFAGRGDRADTDIWLWDTASDELRNLSYPGPIESAPDIAGSLVVWERREVPNGESQLRALDLDSGRLLAPTDGLSGTHFSPVVDGGRVVWRRDWTDPTSPSRILKEFWLYDARTEERRRIGETDEAGIAQLDGDRLCWIQGFARSSTWVHDLSTEKSLRISTRQGQCDISGRRVVLVEYDYGSTLFLRELLPDEL